MYSFQHIERNLTDIFMETVRNSHGFMSCFERVDDTIDTRREWDGGYNYVSTIFEGIKPENQPIDIENAMNRATEDCLKSLLRKAGRMALYGVRKEDGPGGLYFFAREEEIPTINACNWYLDMPLLREAFAAVKGDDVKIICGVNHAKHIKNILGKKSMISVIADEFMLEQEVFLVGGCFGISFRGGIIDIDTSIKENYRRMMRGDFTFVFESLKRRCCRIYNLRGIPENREVDTLFLRK